MAMLSHRLRRVIFAVPSCIERSFSLSRASNFSSVSSLLPRSVVKPPKDFGRSPARLFSTTQYQYDPYTGQDSFTPDNEGCDFNHWLITMDFPKDNPPSREEMISIFEKTCAKGLGISLEEAKNKIYAICTTSYQGFQATMTIGEVEKFRDFPGVQYIIPDSYADVENKVYGGDKYENGVITPGPIPVPTREGFDSLEKENTLGQKHAQGSQAPSDEGPTSGQVQDQGSQIPPDQRSFKQGQGTLAPRQGLGQGSRMPFSGHGLGAGQGSQMLTPRQGQGRGQRSQMPSFQESFKQDQGIPSPRQVQAQGSQVPSFQGSFKQGQGAPPIGQGKAQECQMPSFQESFKQGQGTLPVGQGKAQGSQMPSFQRDYNQGHGTPIHGQGQGQGSQIPSYQMGYSQGQGAQTPPFQGLPSNYSQGALANYNQGSPQGNTQENYNQMAGGNYTPQSCGNYGSAQGAGSPGFGHGYSGHGQDQGDPLLSPYQGSYNQGGQIPSYQMGYSQGLRAPVPPYQGNYNQGTPSKYGQLAFANYNQGPPHGYFHQGPQQNYNQGGQWNFSPQNGGNYGLAQFGQMYPGHAQGQGSQMPEYQLSYNQGHGTPIHEHTQGQGNQMPQYQLSYNQGQGAPFPGQWQCQGCGMPSFQGSYNQGQGTPNPGQWQGQGCAMPSYQASYSHSQGASVSPHQGNYNHGIPSSYGQGTSANFNQGIPVNYNKMGQRNYNPQSSENYGPAHGAARNPGFQQEDQRNVAGDWSNNNNPADPTETGKAIKNPSA